MSSTLRRIVSLILSVAMVVGLVPNVYAAEPNGGGVGTTINDPVPPTGSNGSGTLAYKTSNFNATGYKIQLIFLRMPDDVIMEENDESRRNKIIDCWNNADIRYDDDGEVTYIGKPVYLTRNSLKSFQQNTNYGYFYTDFQYGLGDKATKTQHNRNLGTDRQQIKILSPLDISKKGSQYEMTDADLPINISSGSTAGQRDLIKDYFLYETVNATTKKTEYIPRQNLAALVNYIATDGGANPTNQILFSRVAKNTGTDVTQNTSLTGDEASIFDGNKYAGDKGEYRLIISPYVSIYGGSLGSASNQTAVTLRDMYSLGDSCYRYSQPQFFTALAKALCFDKTDFFNMTGKPSNTLNSVFPSKQTKYVVKALDENVGCGIGLINSDMTRDESLLKKTNIGSITHIFLDGDKVKTASMEYVGKKNEQTENTNKAILQATLQLAKASTDKNGVSTNAFVNEALSSEVLLNGTIKIPTGIGESNSSSLSASFEEFGNAVADKIEAEYKDTDGKLAQQAVETLVSENFGIGNTSKLKDIALGIYILNRFGMDGLDTSTGIENQYIEDNITNKWKQILSYATLLANDKSRATIETGSGWKGAYSITADKITKDTVYGSVPLDNTTYAKVGNAKKLAEAKTAGLDGENGQITVHNGKVLKDIIDGNDKLSDGFVRVPIAFGFNPLSIKHINTSSTGAIKEKTYVTMPKNWVGQMTEALFTQANTGNLLDGTTKTSKEMLSKADITSEHKGVLYNYGGDTGLLGLQTQGYKDVRGTQANVLLSESNILNPVVTGKAFNPVYGKKVNSNAEVQSAYLNTFGINTYIAVGLARGFEKGIKGTETDKAFNSVVQNLNKINGAGAVIVVPKSVETQVNPEGSSGNNVKAANYTEKYLGYINNLTSNVWVLNSAIAANAGSNSGNLVLAVNNYLLNKGLVKAQSSVGTVENTNTDGEGTKYNLGLQGSYGQSYVIWGKGMPVDALLTTEVDGKIVPLEIATSNFDHSVIPDIWTAVEGVDKLLNVNRYYTIKDKTGKEITLEVEEAIVKPASVNGDYTDGNTGKDETSYKAFLDKYYEAIKNNSTQDFAVYKNTYTRRTILDTSILDSSSSNNGGVTNNVDVYIKTHAGLSDPWRDIIEDADASNAGKPHPVEGLVNGINNGLDIVATREDVEAYKNNPDTNRLGVVLKVKIKGDLNQYNMINKVDGTNDTTKVAPETDDKGNYVFKKTIATKNGYATLTPSEGTDKIAKGVVIEYSNGKNDPTATEETKNKSFEDYVTETVLKDVSHSDGDPVQHPAIKRKGVNVTGDNKSLTGTGESLTVPKPNFTPSSIYVKYEEYPPVYEVYRSKTGTEVVVEKPQVWDSKTGNLTGISTGEDGGTLDGGRYIPVSAVANNYDYANSDFQKNMLEDTEEGIQRLKTPTNWKDVLNSRRYTKELNIALFPSRYDDSQSTTHAVSPSFSNNTAKDSQLIGKECNSSAFVKSDGTVDINNTGTTRLNIANLCNGSKAKATGKNEKPLYSFGYRGYTEKPASGTGYGHWYTDYVERTYGTSHDYWKYGYTTDLTPNSTDMYSASDSIKENPKPMKYAIYILYVEDPTNEKSLDGVSAFTYLPEDMITRAVTYKDLARQYFQRQQYLRMKAEAEYTKDTNKEYDVKKRYYKTDFNTWYTLYINMCAENAERVNTWSIPSIDSNAKSITEATNSKSLFETVSGTQYDINKSDTTGQNQYFAQAVSGPDYEDTLAGKEWGKLGKKIFCEEPNSKGEYVAKEITVKSGNAVTGNLVTPGTLSDKAKISFGMSSTLTPATVGTGEGFNNSKDYTSKQYTIHSDKKVESKYWIDVYHGYNDYNFYVMVWRGMNKPMLSSSALSSEQTDIAEIQKQAFNGNHKIANVAIGTQGNNVNGFYSGTDIGIAPRDKREQRAGVVENMYNTVFNLVWKNTSIPQDGSAVTNMLRYGYEASGRHINTTDTAGHRISDRDKYISASANTGTTREDGIDINRIEGRLFVDTYTDAVGKGDSEPTAEELNDLDEFRIKVSDMAYGSDKSELTFYGANANSYKNQWKTPDGEIANLWINLYPFAKMRYQTVNQETGFSETGADGETAVTTHDVYVTAKNQSSMLTSDCIDVGINNGVGVTSTSPVSNLLKINSSQWSTHTRSINSKGAGNVLPGGAIYMLNTGSLSSTVDGANRTKIGIRVWQTYLPETTRAMLVSTNNEYRYTKGSDRTKELNAAKNFYSLSAKNSQAESILQAAMITLNNVDVNLYANDNGTITKLVGGGKYGLQSKEDYTKPSASYSNRYAGNSGYDEDGVVNSNIKGNSASIDTTKLLRGEKTYYRVWSTGEKIMFGWLRSNQNTSPTIGQLSAYKGDIANEHGCLEIPFSWFDAEGNIPKPTENNLAHSIVYSVNNRTKIVTNFYNMLELKSDTLTGNTHKGSKISTTYDMPAGNMADGNNMAYLGNREGYFGSNHTQKGNVYGDMWYGNGVADCGEVETATKLEDYKKALFAKRILSTSDTNSVRLGASWINKCMSLQRNQYYTGDTDNTNPNQAPTATYPEITQQKGWYGEACDGIGVVVSSAVIETGFASPIPTGTDTPVRTSIIDPTWTPKHTGNNGTNATYTVFREVFFQTNASSNLVGAVTTNGGYLSQGSVVSTKRPDNTDNGVLFDVIINNKEQKIRLGKDSNGNQIGFDRLYKSRKFYLPNATVMDLN